MQNCARPWSIRRQPPRCSASSAALPQTCSRSSMPSSRARLGFAASMMWCFDSKTAPCSLRGLILVRSLLVASSVLRSHGFAGCASTARSTSLTAREQRNDFSTLGDGYTLGSVTGARTFLFAPLRLQGEFIGNLTARRSEVRPFTPAQIMLLETFADQAVIAIENVRLFKELKESLKQ